MARTSTYLNFPGTTEEAFHFYRAVFGTEFVATLQRIGEVPEMEGLPEDQRRLVMHVELPILGGHVLMGTDAVASMGHDLQQGNAAHLNLEPDTLDEARRLFGALAEGGVVNQPLEQMFWGATYGAVVDRCGVSWLVNCAAQA